VFVELEVQGQVPCYGTGDEGEDSVGTEDEIVYFEALAQNHVRWISYSQSHKQHPAKRKQIPRSHTQQKEKDKGHTDEE